MIYSELINQTHDPDKKQLLQFIKALHIEIKDDMNVEDVIIHLAQQESFVLYNFHKYLLEKERREEEMKRIEQYKMTLNCKFDEYYDLFLQNGLRCNKYMFTFRDDDIIYVGIPHALTFLTTYDDDEKFALQITSPENMIGHYKIPYREITRAKEMKGIEK